MPEISTEGLTRDDIADLIDKTQKLMQTEYEKLTDESLALNDRKENGLWLMEKNFDKIVKRMM